jgi:phosphonate transport system ATP-binding protein
MDPSHSPPPPAAPPHLHLDALTIERGGQVLVRDLHLAIPRGQFVAVIGPSGIGKSSLLETLAGLHPPSTGTITYCCQHLCHHAPAAFRDRLGLVFQQLHLARNATALQNTLAGALPRHPWWRTLFGLPSHEKARATRCLQSLGLNPYQHHLIRQLSGGEQQRVAIARALLQQPELILADEPVSHLDAPLASRVLELLKSETRRHARTVLCVLHDHSLVDRFADAVLALGTGRRTDWHWMPNHA